MFVSGIQLQTHVVEYAEVVQGNIHYVGSFHIVFNVSCGLHFLSCGVYFD